MASISISDITVSDITLTTTITLSGPAARPGMLYQLRELAALLKDGSITRDEFAQLKQRVLEGGEL